MRCGSPDHAKKEEDVADYVVRHLRGNLWQRNIVFNRQVQIRRGRCGLTLAIPTSFTKSSRLKRVKNPARSFPPDGLTAWVYAALPVCSDGL